MRIDPNEAFRRQVSRPDAGLDLMHAALLIAADEYPELDVPHYLARLDAWGEDLSGRVSARADVEVRISQLNRFMFDELGFSGDSSTYYDPRNSYMNEVLERRRGIPISLSVVYMELGRRVALNFAGVSFPGHFLVKLSLRGGEVVIDPFHRGVSLSATDLMRRLQNLFDADIQTPAPYLAAASNKNILVRMLYNLKGIYRRQGKAEKTVSVINKLLLVDPQLTSEYRERGLLLNQLECYHAALKDLQHYLNVTPDVEGTGPIRELALRLQEQHGRLN